MSYSQTSKREREERKKESSDMGVVAVHLRRQKILVDFCGCDCGGGCGDRFTWIPVRAIASIQLSLLLRPKFLGFSHP